MEESMRCEEIMKGDVSTVSRDATVQEAARLMAEEDIGFLPVVDGSGKAVGTVTDRDIVVRLVAQGLPADSIRVHQVMTNKVVTCKRSDDLKAAQERMKQSKVSRILAVDDKGAPVGVISLGDLAERQDEGAAGSTLREVKEGVSLTH
ncbi:MAG: CBS domain-containing protein [Deltaproteobacteria bacterium]|nr:MAG: CBS domain-containing protein [Deltaproteobacteria bacterium]